MKFLYFLNFVFKNYSEKNLSMQLSYTIIERFINCQNFIALFLSIRYDMDIFIKNVQVSFLVDL